ncbi:hypothetical protein [Neolewinella persica]|uniref:hypothetical protein n=1 Tax=Neolewinella persica TaxID=70998 RepID=UPI0003697DDF|nr:hypothetical protein [Neolewinella persica]
MKYLLPLFVLAFVFYACGGDSATDALPSNPYAAATKMAQDQMEVLQENNNRAVYETATMKEMLPETLLGLPRKSIAANGVGAGGFKMATANATYQADGERRRITVTLTDGMGGNLPGMGMINSFTMDKEEGTKTTKTMEVDGRKAVREFDSANNRGSLSVIFPQSIVQIEGRYLNGIGDLKDAYDALDLDELE